MSQAGGPSQEAARGIIRFVPDLSEVENAKREVEKHFEDMATAAKDRMGAALREVFDDLQRRAEALKATVEGIRLPEAQGEAARTPDPTERAKPDEMLAKLTEIHGVAERIESTVESIDGKIKEDQ